jgi:RNA 3'-terminal phosphate cyclase (ATP)
MLHIDGSYGEGGGQIVRTALTLSCITAVPIEISNIRAGRSQGGLRNQHLTCVHAAADICAAEVTGDAIGSEQLTFIPTREVRPGHYQWEIPSAGATTLVMQTVLLPLAMAGGTSEIHITGGTHVPFSPSAHYLRDVYAPMLIQSGAEVTIRLDKLGWNPRGGGEIVAYLEGWAQLQGQDLLERGDLERIFGDGLATNLPAHIPQRMATHAQKLLEQLNLDVPIDVRLQRDSSSSSKGAGVFLTAEYSNGRAGFSALGEHGFPSERVAEEAIYAFELFHAGNASVDEHLADQLVLVLALAEGGSQYISPRITDHLRTNVWVIRQFMERGISLDEYTGRVKIEG